MKKVILSIFLAAAFLSSCSDAYEVDQPGYVSDENKVFADYKDIQRGINGLYSSLPGESEINFTSYFTDELGVGVNNAGQGINDGSYTFVLQAGNSFATGIWGSYYNVINRTNRILNRIEQLYKETPDATPELNYQKATLLGLRAYCHYKLFAYFTPDYSNSAGLSIIKLDFLQTDDYSRFEKRSTVGEIVAFIEKDIADAKVLGKFNADAQDSNISSLEQQSNTIFMSYNVLDAVLVKMYSMLQTSDSYSKMEQAFNRLTTNEVAPKAIGDAISYSAMFEDDETASLGSEAIFRLKRTDADGGVTDGVASAWYSARVSTDQTASAAYMEMGRSLYNELDKLDPASQGEPYNDANPRNDVRYTRSVLNGSTVNPDYMNLSAEAYRNGDKLYIGKYTGIENRPLMNSIWLFRFTDMLLALAEKRAAEGNYSGTVALGDFSNVESIIYNIRSNRNSNGVEPLVMPTNFSNAQQAYARILEERRVEFAFEGTRYLDMKRLGKKAATSGFVRDPKDCEGTGACSLEPTSNKLTLPIPRTEMLANPKMVQNPGF